ncbi:hypothetical protein VN12_04380 [Pirellula sp. SH-Sr6A]|nr:hypothetical protein VN12_04380 [Pirellula sp. SH-Sr6A]
MLWKCPSVTAVPAFASKLTEESQRVSEILASIKPLPNATTNSGIVIPNERTHKQPNFAFCANPKCAENGLEFRFQIEDTLMPCPKCGATHAPLVGMLAKTHLLVQDRMGHLVGSGGLRYRIACDTENKRHVISTPENHELATGDRRIANCLDCLKVTTPDLTGHALHAR